MTSREGRRWTKQEEKLFRRLWETNVPSKEIAASLNRTVSRGSCQKKGSAKTRTSPKNNGTEDTEGTDGKECDCSCSRGRIL